MRRRANMDSTRIARNALLDDFVRHARELKLENRLPGFLVASHLPPFLSLLFTTAHFAGATFEMRKHLEIWGEKGKTDIIGYNSNFFFKLIARIRSFMGIFDHPAGSKLIHPLSYFWISCRIMSGFFIMYMCIESPAILAFYWNEDACAVSPTRELSLALELAFLVEIILNFFVGFYDELSGEQASDD